MLGIMPLNSLIMQDDISKMNDTLEQAREGCRLIDDTLSQKQLSVNYDKSKYLLIGSAQRWLHEHGGGNYRPLREREIPRGPD